MHQTNNRIILSIVCIIIINILVYLEYFSDFHEPILKYMFGTLFIFYWIRGTIFNQTAYKNDQIGFLFYLFLFWTFLMILGGLNFEDLFLKRVLSGHFYFYFFPLIVLINFNVDLIRKIIGLSTALMIIVLLIIISLFNFLNILSPFLFEKFSKSFAAISGFMFLIYYFLNRFTKVLTILTIFLILMLNVYLGRRAEFSYYLLCIFFGILINVFFTAGYSSMKRKINTILMIILFSFSLSTFYFINKEKFSFIVHRFESGYKNRELVINELVKDLDVTNSWIIGKGISGEYKSKYHATTSMKTRDIIENGYLNMILKGGIIYLILFSIISIKAIYLGFFKSKNAFTKALSTYLVINLIIMFGFGVPELLLKYLLVWISISGCLSLKFRELTDSQIVLLLNQKKSKVLINK